MKKGKNKVGFFLLLLLMLFISVKGALAQTGQLANNNYTYSYIDYSASTYVQDGIVVWPKYNISVYNVTAGGPDIINVTVRSPALTGSVVGSTATKVGTTLVFTTPLNLTKGQNYSFTYTQTGSWNRNISAATLPIQSPHLNYSNRVDSGVIRTDNYLHNFNQIITCQQNETCFTTVAVNFTITATAIGTGTSINNFSANVSGTIYSTTTGTITTNLLTNDTSLHNITIFNANDSNGAFFNKTYNDYNVSIFLISSNMYQADIGFSAYKLVTNDSLTGSFVAGSLSGTNRLQLLATSYNITFVNTSFFNKTESFTYTALANSSSSINDVYDSYINLTVKDIYTNATLNNFTGWYYNPDYTYNKTINNTVNTTIILPIIRNLNWSVFAENPDYAITNFSTITNNASNTVNNYTIYLYTTNTISFTVKDEETDTKITWENITLELIGDLQSYNFTTHDGNYTATLLNPQEYTIRYFGANYAERFYVFELTNRTFNSLTLYAINKTRKGNITITVIDEDANTLENARVQALKYYLSSNSYVLQEIGTTDVNGNTVMSLTLYDEFYKFIVVYNDVVVKTTTPSYINDPTFTIQVVVGGTTASNFYEWKSISSDLSFNKATDNFRLDYVDASGLSTNICLNTYKWVAAARTQINSTCSTSASGTILSYVTASNGTTYEVQSTYTDDDGNVIQLSRLAYTYPVTDIIGTVGVIMQIFLTVTLVLMTSWNLPLSLLMIPISFIIGSALRFNAFGIESISVSVILSIVLLYLIRRRG